MNVYPNCEPRTVQDRFSDMEVGESTASTHTSAPVTRDSPPDAKIELFRSLFRGRDDVYPRRFESRKTGRAGYALACANERESCSDHIRPLICHASAIVDDQADRCRRIFGLENLDLLFPAILIDVEIARREAGYRSMSRVKGGYVKYRQIDIDR